MDDDIAFFITFIKFSVHLPLNGHKTVLLNQIIHDLRVDELVFFDGPMHSSRRSVTIYLNFTSAICFITWANKWHQPTNCKILRTYGRLTLLKTACGNSDHVLVHKLVKMFLFFMFSSLLIMFVSGCQIILTKEMEGMELTLPMATKNFYVDGHVPQPH